MCGGGSPKFYSNRSWSYYKIDFFIKNVINYFFYQIVNIIEVESGYTPYI